MTCSEWNSSSSSSSYTDREWAAWREGLQQPQQQQQRGDHLRQQPHLQQDPLVPHAGGAVGQGVAGFGPVPPAGGAVGHVVPGLGAGPPAVGAEVQVVPGLGLVPPAGGAAGQGGLGPAPPAGPAAGRVVPSLVARPLAGGALAVGAAATVPKPPPPAPPPVPKAGLPPAPLPELPPTRLPCFLQLRDDVVQLQQQVQQLQAALQILVAPQQPQQEQQEQRQQKLPEELFGDEAVQAATAADGMEYDWRDGYLFCVACNRCCMYQGHRTGKDHKKQVGNLEWYRKDREYREREGLPMIRFLQ